MKAISKCLAVICTVAVIATCACNKQSEDSRPVLAVSIEPQRNILEQLAGDNFRIITVIPEGESPETFEPTPSKRIDIENSKAYFTTGLLVFEENLKLASNDDAKFVNTSDGIDLIYEHSHADNHSMFLPDVAPGEAEIEADPHIWLSVRNARKIAANMTAELINIDADNADTYTANYNALCQRLDSIDNVFKTRIDSIGSPAFMLWHPSMGYFARDYGLKMITMGHENKEVSATSLKQLIDSAKHENARVFLYQAQIDSRQAESISSSAGARLVEFNPLAYDWISELSKVVDELSKQ